MIKSLSVSVLLVLTTACASGGNQGSLERALAGQSQVSGAKLVRSVGKASVHPLGSRENPVRAEMPVGELAYLARLRCSDGRAPQFQRGGSVGNSPYGNIMDVYDVNCGEDAPGRVSVYMDMYHRNHRETRPVPGFTIVP